MKEQSKDKFITKITIPIKRGKTRASIEQAGEPIYEYADWTPELQVQHDKMIKDLAQSIYYQIKEYERKGIDISKLGTPEVNQQIKDIHQAKQKQREKEAQLRKIKKNMTDEELEEFLKWKESKKKTD